MLLVDEYKEQFLNVLNYEKFGHRKYDPVTVSRRFGTVTPLFQNDFETKKCHFPSLFYKTGNLILGLPVVWLGLACGSLQMWLVSALLPEVEKTLSCH